MEFSVSVSPSGMLLDPFVAVCVVAASLRRDSCSGRFELGGRQLAATDDEQAQVDRAVEQKGASQRHATVGELADDGDGAAADAARRSASSPTRRTGRRC